MSCKACGKERNSVLEIFNKIFGTNFKTMNALAKYKTPKDIRQERLRTCINCPYSKDKKICTACGCIIQAKTALAISQCPKGYWKQ